MKRPLKGVDKKHYCLIHHSRSNFLLDLLKMFTILNDTKVMALGAYFSMFKENMILWKSSSIYSTNLHYYHVYNKEWMKKL